MPRQPEFVKEEFIDYVAEGIALRKPKSKIRRDLEELISESMHHQTFLRLYRKARQKLLKNSRKTPESARAEALAFYEHTISEDSTSYNMKLVAQQRLDMLFDLEQKSREPDSPEDKAAKIRQFLAEADETVADEPEDDDGSEGSGQEG